MIKIINHEVRLAKLAYFGKLILAFLGMSLFATGAMANNDYGFSKDDAKGTGEQIYFYWYYFGRWAVILVSAIGIIGNLLFSDSVKMKWYWFAAIMVAVGMFGDVILSKLLNFDLVTLQETVTGR